MSSSFGRTASQGHRATSAAEQCDAQASKCERLAAKAPLASIREAYERLGAELRQRAETADARGRGAAKDQRAN